MNSAVASALGLLTIVSLLPPVVHAQSTITADNRHAYAANAGWIDARPSATDGGRLTDNVCSGYLYAANVGWIHLGGGAPANGIRYGNASATDYGVNVFTYAVDLAQAGQLRGYAYGANIGWIAFEDQGNPRIDLTTGRLSGFAYSANVGWINLGEFSASITSSLAPATDTDNDSIPDAWERSYFGDLTTAGPGSDFDNDGQPDWIEFAADTDPKNATDLFRLTSLAPNLAASPGQVTVTFTSRPTRRYRLAFGTGLSLPVNWIPSGLGTFTPDAGPSTTRTFSTTDAPQAFIRAEVLRPLTP
jgi:hypothetical protein